MINKTNLLRKAKNTVSGHKTAGYIPHRKNEV